MEQQVTIKKVSISNTKKDGTPLLTKNGKPFQKVGIQVIEYGETWINGLWFDGNCPWVDGSKLSLIIKDEEYNGVTKKVFDLPRKKDETLTELNGLAIKVGLINVKIDKILNHLSGKDRLDLTSDGTSVPFEEV